MCTNMWDVRNLIPIFASVPRPGCDQKDGPACSTSANPFDMHTFLNPINHSADSAGVELIVEWVQLGHELHTIQWSFFFFFGIMPSSTQQISNSGIITMRTAICSTLSSSRTADNN